MRTTHQRPMLGRLLLIALLTYALPPVALGGGTPPLVPARGVTSEQVTITSTERGATVFAGGKRVGALPFRWDAPDVTGTITLQAARRGGPAETLTIFYSGGTVSKVRSSPPKDAPPAPVAASIFFATLPPMADIYLEGKKIGIANVAELTLPPGTYSLRFVKGPREVIHQCTLFPGKNPTQLVRLP